MDEHEQLAIPMPVVAAQVVIHRHEGAGWVVRSLVLRQDDGWQHRATYSQLVRPEVLDLAVSELETILEL